MTKKALAMTKRERLATTPHYVIERSRDSSLTLRNRLRNLGCGDDVGGDKPRPYE
jgi:hypothetical protein